MIGASVGAVITIMYGFRLNIVIVSGVYVVMIVATFLFQYESLPKEKRKPMQSACYNPLKPLFKLRYVTLLEL